MHKIPSIPTNIEWGDASSSKVLGLGKVVISHDLTIEKVMLVESLAFNLLSVHQLALMGFATFFDIDTVALLWSKTLKALFGSTGFQGVWSRLAGIKSPTSQNPYQTPPILSNPLVVGINRTRPKVAFVGHVENGLYVINFSE